MNLKGVTIIQYNDLNAKKKEIVFIGLHGLFLYFLGNIVSQRFHKTEIERVMPTALWFKQVQELKKELRVREG